MAKRSVTVVVLALFATAATALAAEPLALDTTFGGGDGWLTVPVGSSSSAAGLARTTDGKVVMAGRSDGDIAVVELTSAGDPVASFGGGDGIATLDLGGTEAVAAVALDAQDRIVVVGTGEPDLFVVRFGTDGQPDASFGGGDGIVRYRAGTADTSAEDVAITDGGRIAVAGTRTSDGGPRLLALRLRATGVLDEAFGGDGAVTTRVGGPTRGAGVAIDGKGRVVAAGRSANGDDGDAAIVRFQADGTLDPAFGKGDGRAILDFDPTGDDAAEAVAIQPDGKVVVVGTLNSAAGKAIGIVGRLQRDGTPDVDFGANARRRLGLAEPAQALHDVLIEPDDDITVAGQVGGDVLVATLSPDGRTVTWRSVDPVGGNDQGNGVVRLGSGKLLVAGRIADIPPFTRAITLTPQFGLLRFLPA